MQLFCLGSENGFNCTQRSSIIARSAYTASLNTSKIYGGSIVTPKPHLENFCLQVVVEHDRCVFVPLLPKGSISKTIELMELSTMTKANLTNRLRKVHSYVAAVTSSSPRPHPLCSELELMAFMEHSLKLVQSGTGPAPAILLYQIIALLDPGRDQQCAKSWSNFAIHLSDAFDTACMSDIDALTPQAFVLLFEAWACLASLPQCRPSTKKVFTSRLWQMARTQKFEARECSRLLIAFASIMRRGSPWRPLPSLITDLRRAVIGDIRKLSDHHLGAVADATAAFPWPLYSSAHSILRAICSETLVRMLVDKRMTESDGQVALSSAIEAAGEMTPAFGFELKQETNERKGEVSKMEASTMYQDKLIEISNILAIEARASLWHAAWS